MKKLLTLLLSVSAVGAIEVIADPSETLQFLEIIASAEPASWENALETLKEDFPQWMEESTPREILNDLAASSLKEDNLPLIDLLRRALRNYNELSQEKTNPFTFYYKHYQPPAFFIPNIELTLDVQSDRVLVTSRLFIHRNAADASLVLDGQKHTVFAVSVNDQPLSKEQYRVTPNELIILNAPEEEDFTVSIESEIDPFHNDALMGLYATEKFLVSQCESEGARRIFYTLDRPDVLSRITTTIIADKEKYPSRLSNGNWLEETLMPDGKTKIVWEDPIPKPSYLFACVLGNFGKIEDTFTTRSGRKVILEVYVEPGKEERATYALASLKKSMEFDELFFDREYDLDYLKMVAAPDFNSGAMENKGLMIFNDLAFLVDPHSGTDASFRRIACIVAHEYFHNWSGNRVTVRNWFELSLKEGFTDFRAMLFGEWMFGSAFLRPKDVTGLREGQFPQETSERGHPIMVESYVAPSSIYDSTTYTKGREVFRTLQTYLDMMIPGGFRKAQNLYFERYDGQAVTFRELLQAANDVLVEHTGKDLSQFERWFTQQGTPQITVEMKRLPETKQIQIKLAQSCPHPRTGAQQEPFLIPFSYELLRKDGSVAFPKQTFAFSEEVHLITIDSEEELIPLFMHNYAAPVILNYPYSLEELACLMKHAADPFSRWEAGQTYSLLALQQAFTNSKDLTPLLKNYADALQNPLLPPIAKAQLLQLPSLRAMAQKFDQYDFIQLKKTRDLFAKQLATTCRPLLEKLLEQYPEPKTYIPISMHMQIRELRNACLNLLTQVSPDYIRKAYNNYYSADNFDTSFALFQVLMNRDTPLKSDLVADFYDKWKADKVVFNHWLSVQAASSFCTVDDLKKLMATDGYDAKNPNHIRSVLCTFAANLSQYHDPKGEGYAFLVDQILEVGKYNPLLAHNYLAMGAFVDFEKLPKKQQALMIREMKRLQSPESPPETRDLIQKMLERSSS